MARGSVPVGFRRAIGVATATLALVSTSVAQGSTCSTTRGSLTSTGQECNAPIRSALIARGGGYLAFTTGATNVVPNGPAHTVALYVRNLASGETRLVTALPAGFFDFLPDLAFSSDGRFLAYDAIVNGHNQVFVYDWTSASSTLIFGSASYDALAASISADGRFVAYARAPSPGGDGQVYLYDRTLGTHVLASADSSGVPGNGESGMEHESKAEVPISTGTAVSDDGRYVAFSSLASNLGGAPLSLSFSNVFVHDIAAATTFPVNVDVNGQPVAGNFAYPRMSGDGHSVSFASYQTSSELLPGVPINSRHMFVRNLTTGTTELLTVLPNGAPAPSSPMLVPAVLSTNGRFAVFGSSVAGLVAGDGPGLDVFVRDRLAHTTEIVNRSTSGQQVSGIVAGHSITGDGSTATFISTSAIVVPNDTNGFADAFVRSCTIVPTAFCFGDGSGAACPCGNSGSPGHGCENSAATGGALLSATGQSSLSADTLTLVSSAELPTALSIPSQGTAAINPVFFGDGLRCTGGSLKRLYEKNAVGGVVSVPQAGDLSISARSAQLGDVIASGSTRYYYTYYRDPSTTFCATPPGNTWNVTNNLAVVWTD
jgi:Tol biopolymer transport system component